MSENTPEIDKQINTKLEAYKIENNQKYLNLTKDVDFLKRSEIFHRELIGSLLKRIDNLENPDLSPSLKAFQELRRKLDLSNQ